MRTFVGDRMVFSLEIGLSLITFDIRDRTKEPHRPIPTPYTVQKPCNSDRKDRTRKGVQKNERQSLLTINLTLPILFLDPKVVPLSQFIPTKEFIFMDLTFRSVGSPPIPRMWRPNFLVNWM